MSSSINIRGRVEFHVVMFDVWTWTQNEMAIFIGDRFELIPSNFVTLVTLRFMVVRMEMTVMEKTDGFSGDDMTGEKVSWIVDVNVIQSMHGLDTRSWDLHFN